MRTNYVDMVDGVLQAVSQKNAARSGQAFSQWRQSRRVLAKTGEWLAADPKKRRDLPLLRYLKPDADARLNKKALDNGR